MELSISRFFASESRARLLVLLWKRTGAASLRELSELSKCALCATAASLKTLRREGLVSKKNIGKECLFKLNRTHKLYPMINALCQACENEYLVMRSQSYATRPFEIVNLCSDSLEFLQHVRTLNNGN